MAKDNRANGTEDWIERIIDEDEVDQRPPRKRNGALIVTIILLLMIIGVAGGAYVYAAMHFRDHFYNGTTINGQDVSNLTVEDVKRGILTGFTDYSLTIRERGGVTEVIRGDDIGWTYDDAGEVDSIMRNQDPWKWILKMNEEKAYSFSAERKYDSDLANKAIDALDCLDPAKVEEPKDALLNMTSESASIVPEIEGNKVDKEKLRSLVIDALNQQIAEIDLEANDCYYHPTILSTDENLVRRMEQWNGLTNLNITYRFGESVETVDRETLIKYMKDDGDNVSVATDWVRALVGNWAEKYNSFGRERLFKTHEGTTVLLPAYTEDAFEKDAEGKPVIHTSDYGWLLDADATAEDLVGAIDRRESGERQAVFKYKGWGWDNNGLGNTYVEVSLTAQKLWIYKDGAEVLSSDVVTGMPTPQRQTYPGCFAVDAKKSPATLGTVATQGYSSDVEFWLPFDGGRGLHDAPWRTTFGGDIFLYNGSHGCVNIPPEKMKAIFDLVEIGMAVCVY